MLDFPVDIPGLKNCKISQNNLLSSLVLFYLHGTESPGLDMIAVIEAHPHDLIRGHTKQLIFLFAMESNDKKRNPIIW